MNDLNSGFNTLRDKLDDLLPGGRLVSVVLSVLGIYLLVCVLLGMYWSIAPEHFNVRERAATYAAEDGGKVVTGSVTTAISSALCAWAFSASADISAMRPRMSGY